MKKTLLTLSVIWSVDSFGQCTNCSSFEEALKEPENVKTLKMNPWQHKITLDSLPPAIGKFVNVETIHLTGHNFEAIPKEIGNLKNLRELSFAECKLKELPDEIFLLENLREIILLNNEFPEEYKRELKTRFKQELPKTKLVIN